MLLRTNLIWSKGRRATGRFSIGLVRRGVCPRSSQWQHVRSTHYSAVAAGAGAGLINARLFEVRLPMQESAPVNHAALSHGSVLSFLSLPTRYSLLLHGGNSRRPPATSLAITHSLRARNHVPHGDARRLLGPPRPDALCLTLDAQAACHITTATRALPRSHRPTLRHGALR